MNGGRTGEDDKNNNNDYQKAYKTKAYKAKTIINNYQLCVHTALHVSQLELPPLIGVEWGNQ